MIQKLFFVFVLIVALASLSYAQEETQIGVRAIGANTSIPGVEHPTFGVGADTIINLGEHVSVHGTGQVSRLKLRKISQPARHYEADGDIRVAPFSMSGVYLFGAAGANVQRLSTPFGSQSFLSPTLGGGVGYSRYGNLTYKHGFADVISPLGVRFDEVGLNTYIPMSEKSKWRGRLGASYRKSFIQNAKFVGGGNNEFSVLQFYVGVSRVIGGTN
jgi:hypothetical protein